MKPLAVGIIGCGGVGRKRAMQLLPESEIYCSDIRGAKAVDLAHDLTKMGREALPVHYWQDVVRTPSVQAIIISTTHDMLAPLALKAIQNGKHVLIEKPGACSVDDIDQISAAATQAKVAVRIGFNHRYHPAFRKAFELFSGGAIGDPMMVRGRYGHGGRTGYEKEWRADPAKGGGELLDQGVHLIDLARAFLGDFCQISGCIKTLYWNMPVEDNAFMILQTKKGQIAHLHASCTEWRNLFSFEVYGTKGKLHVEGLGGSYGLERLAYYRMLPQMGPPETTIWEYPQTDESWKLEMEDFFAEIRAGVSHVRVDGARAALHVVEQIRLQSASDTRTVEHADMRIPVTE